MKDEQNDLTTRADVEEEAQAGFDNRLPRRYRLYDKIKDHVSLRTIDTIIVVTALLIVGLLIYSVATRTRS